MLSIVLSACGGDDSGDGGAGAGGGSSSGGGDSTCDGVCNAMFAQDCFYGGGEQDCRMSCEGWETQYVAVGPDFCKTAWADYKTCMSSQALTCDPDGNPDWGAVTCRDHWDHFNNYCINQNATPDTPCTENAAFDAFCADTPATPKGKSCFGDYPAECVVGGTQNNSNLYCCP